MLALIATSTNTELVVMQVQCLLQLRFHELYFATPKLWTIPPCQTDCRGLIRL